MEKNSGENINSKKIINAIEIPADGSLGLLALGAVGIKAWRKKRDEEKLKPACRTGRENKKND